MRAPDRIVIALAGLGAAAWLAACQTPAPVPAPGAGPAAVSSAPAAGPAATAAAPAPEGKPRIEVAEKAADLGEVRQGEKATHTFVLRNTGTGVLHIHKAKGS